MKHFFERFYVLYRKQHSILLYKNKYCMLFKVTGKNIYFKLALQKKVENQMQIKNISIKLLNNKSAYL